MKRLEVVDGFGTLAIPGGIYDVLREKRTDFTSTAVDVHTFLGWVDIGSIIGGQLPGFGTDTTITNHFLSNTTKEPIAIVTIDPTQSFATQVEYKDLGITSAVSPVTDENNQVVISPNPVSNEATFDLKIFLPENTIYDCLMQMAKMFYQKNLDQIVKLFRFSH